MVAIHLIEKVNRVHPVRGTSDEWESGDWVVAADRAQKLIGADLYLHKKQGVPSHFGGTIISFRTLADGRVAFRFKMQPSHRGVITSRKGWGNEQKIEGLDVIDPSPPASKRARRGSAQGNASDTTSTPDRLERPAKLSPHDPTSETIASSTSRPSPLP